MLNKQKSPFKVCALCGYTWSTREQFLSDPDVVLGGYQANREIFSAGLFLFTHQALNCNTALAIEVTDLADLYTGPIFPERKMGTQSCPGYCLHQSSIHPCINDCECAFIRVLLKLIREWPKEI